MNDHERDSAPISVGEGAGWRPWETPGQVPFAPAEEQEQPGEADRSIWSAVQEQVLRENGRSDGAASAAASSVGDGAAFGGARGGAARGGAYDFSAGSSTIHDASSAFSGPAASASAFASAAASAFSSADPIDDIVRKVRRGRRVRLAIWCVIAAVFELFVVALCWMLGSDPDAAQVLRIAAIVLGVVLVAFTAPLFVWARYPDLSPDERERFRAAVESFASGDFAGGFNESAGFAGFSGLTGNGAKGMIYNPLRNAPGFISIVLPALFGPVGIILELVLASLRHECFRRSDRFFVWWFAGWGIGLGLICWFGVRLVVAALSGGIHITS